MTPLNSNANSAGKLSAAASTRQPGNSYRGVEDQVYKDMDRRDAKAIEAGKEKEKTVDTNNAVGAVVEQQKPIQDVPDEGASEQAAVKATDSFKEAKEIVGILEGFETPNAESDGTVNQDFAGLLNDEIQQQATVTQADLIQAGTSVEELSEQPAEQTGSLENINKDAEELISEAEHGQENSLLAMMQSALNRASKNAKADTASQDEQPDTMDASAILGGSQQTRTEGVVADEFRVDTLQQPQVTQADMNYNVSQLVESIQAHAADGQQEFTVHLKPEFLGKLSIKLVMDDDGIRAQIKAQDMNSKSLILQELPGLEATLKAKGLDVRHIEVAYEAPKFDFNPQQNSQQSWQFTQEQPKGRFHMFPVEADSVFGYFDLTSSVEQYFESSSMEFTA